MANQDFPDFSRGVSMPDFDGKKIVGVMVLAALVLGGWSSFYTVPAEAEGVVLRFGKYLKTTEPGLRFKIPFNIDRVAVVPVRRQLKQEFGFATAGLTDPSQATDTAEQAEEKSMVTGDLNAALVEWVIQYRINDPKDFLFNVRNPKETLRDVSESVMREVVGDRTVDEVITIGRQEIESEALAKLRDIVLKYKMGLGIDQVQLKDVNPPRPVQPSFDEVNNAKQQREEQINVATGEYYKEVPKAKGEADQKIRAAEGYASKRINEAQGDVARFNAILEEYLKAPDVTKRRIYLETMTKVMPQLGSKIIIDEEAKQILPLLNLSEGGKK
ncbi:MAG: FtsH protease activity modulator HflK [Verrucomicrobiales bacterium]|nr:FtsH protease activity modulator HflK [Verrucomicrobiae bacterium]